MSNARGLGIPFLGDVSGTTIVVAALAAIVIAVLVYAVVQSTGGGSSNPGWLKAELDADPKLPGVYVKPNPGPDGKFGTGDDRQHFAPGTKVAICSAEQLAQDAAVSDVYAERPAIKDCYNSNPPTSGPHSSSPMQIKVLDNPAPKENLVHNMEHGAVVVWYNTDDQGVIDQLKSIVNDALDRRRMVVMSKYTEMEQNTIALTSWTRLDKFGVSEFDKKRIQDFIAEHQRRFNPEGF